MVFHSVVLPSNNSESFLWPCFVKDFVWLPKRTLNVTSDTPSLTFYLWPGMFAVILAWQTILSVRLCPFKGHFSLFVQLQSLVSWCFCWAFCKVFFFVCVYFGCNIWHATLGLMVLRLNNFVKLWRGDKCFLMRFRK